MSGLAYDLSLRTINKSNRQISSVMNNFIEEYLSNHAQAVASAVAEADSRRWYDEVEQEMIDRQIASPEFRLYEEMILCGMVPAR